MYLVFPYTLYCQHCFAEKMFESANILIFIHNYVEAHFKKNVSYIFM